MNEGVCGLVLLALLFMLGALGKCDSVVSPVGGTISSQGVR